MFVPPPPVWKSYFHRAFGLQQLFWLVERAATFFFFLFFFGIKAGVLKSFSVVQFLFLFPRSCKCSWIQLQHPWQSCRVGIWPRRGTPGLRPILLHLSTLELTVGKEPFWISLEVSLKLVNPRRGNVFSRTIPSIYLSNETWLRRFHSAGFGCVDLWLFLVLALPLILIFCGQFCSGVVTGSFVDFGYHFICSGCWVTFYLECFSNYSSYPMSDVGLDLGTFEILSMVPFP